MSTVAACSMWSKCRGFPLPKTCQSRESCLNRCGQVLAKIEYFPFFSDPRNTCINFTSSPSDGTVCNGNTEPYSAYPTLRYISLRNVNHSTRYRNITSSSSSSFTITTPFVNELNLKVRGICRPLYRLLYSTAPALKWIVVDWLAGFSPGCFTKGL